MPKAFKEAKELAKALYLQGFKPKQIAEKIGCKSATVNTWALRYKWRALNDKALELGNVSERMKAYEHQIRSRLASHLDKSTAFLEHADAPTSIKAMKEHAEAMIPVTGVASKVFGWGNQLGGPGSLVQVNVLSGTTKASIQSNIADEAMATKGEPGTTVDLDTTEAD